MEEETPVLHVHFYVRPEKDEIAFSVAQLAEKSFPEIADLLEQISDTLRMYPNVPISTLKKNESDEFVRRYHEREIRRQEYPVVRPLPEKQKDD